MGVEKEELVQAMEASGEVESLYRPIHQKEGSEISLLDKLEEKEHREEKILDRMLLGQLLEKLDGQERTLIYLRYFAEKTQSAVGNGKRKIMWCLTILVVAAVAIGVIYYVKTNMSPAQQTKGYLIRKVEEISHGC